MSLELANIQYAAAFGVETIPGVSLYASYFEILNNIFFA